VEASTLFHIQLCGSIIFSFRDSQNNREISNIRRNITPLTARKKKLHEENTDLQKVAFNNEEN